MRIVRQTAGGLQEADLIFYQRSDWAEGKYADRIVKNGQVIWKSSPYDAATTRYLKATYPDHWQAIRNFGFDNPQLVPWINEDNDLIVSLVGVGKERWLVGDGVAYIDTGIVVTSQNMESEMRAKSARTSSFETYWGFMHSSTNPRLGIHNYSNGIMVSANSTDKAFSLDENPHIYKALLDGRAKWWKDKQTYQGGTYNFSTNTLSIYLFARHNSGGAGNIGKMSESYWKFEIDGQQYNFVPCTHNGAAGMLDIVNAQWYGNANTSGAFTIELTDTPT